MFKTKQMVEESKNQMSKRKKLLRQRGLSLVEAMVAVTIMAISVASVSTLQTQVLQQTRRTNDKAFAAQKATQMFEELRSYVQANREEPLKSLQDYFSNGATEYVPTLTIEKRPDPGSPNNRRRDFNVQANDPLSNNVRRGEHWKYVRNIMVEPVPSDPDARHVTVKIWHANQAGEPNDVSNPLAVITGILKTNIPQRPPTQVYDMYILALENVPGWWVDVSTLRPIFDRTLDDMMARNPGLEIRKHYISHLGYGRDPYYMPYINVANELRDHNTPFVYMYPGSIKDSTDDDSVTEVYVDRNIAGRRRNDVTGAEDQIRSIFKATDAIHAQSGNTADVYREYAIADQYNTVMRYPEESAMHKRLETWFKEDNPFESFQRVEPSLRMLLEGMNSDPDTYRNSMIMNLHGELLPVPPIRNYSDPARVPCDEFYAHCRQGDAISANPTENEYRYRNMRVVSHPEKLYYPNSGADSHIRLRVHGYQSVPLREDSLPTPPDPGTVEFDRDHVEKVSIFVPTNGAGYDPRDPSNSGFLDNPLGDLSANLGGVQNALQVEKLVGNQRRGYERRYATQWRNIAGAYISAASTTMRGFTRLTAHDLIVNYAGPAANNPNQWVQPLAFVAGNTTQLRNPVNGFSGAIQDDTMTGLSRVYRITGGNQIQIKVRGDNTALTANQITAMQDLIDSKIVINARRSDENESTEDIDSNPFEFARVSAVAVNSPANGFVTLTLYENLSQAYNTIHPISTANVGTVAYNNNVAIVTRHRDYDIVVGEQAPFGHNTPGVLVNLYDTPTRHPQCNNTGSIHNNCGSNVGISNGNRTGLAAARRLYRQEYIPAPVNANSFDMDLTDTGNSGNNHKNTARWVVEFRKDGVGNPFSIFDDEMVTFETRLGRARTPGQRAIHRSLLEDGLAQDGIAYQPNQGNDEHLSEMRRNLYNVSRTYAWSGNAIVPKTEQFQYMGDHRFMPYADAKSNMGLAGGFDTGSVRRAYNPYFTNANNNNGLSDFVLTNRVNHNIDFPRYGRLYVDGLMHSTSIFNSISGYSNYYMGTGGDFGADSNNTRYHVNRQSFTEGNDSGSNYIDNCNNNVCVSDVAWGEHGRNKIVFSNRNANNNQENTRWYGIFWQGDLFPDEEYVYWKFNGNLPTQGHNSTTHNLCPSSHGACNRTGSASYWRGEYETTPLSLHRTRKNPNTAGSVAFMNGNPTGSGNRNFGHGSNDNATGSLTNVAGSALNRAFNLSLEANPRATRPFHIDKDGNKPTYYDTGGADGGAYMANYRNTLSYINVQNSARETTRNNANTFYFSSNDGSEVASGIVEVKRDEVGTGYVLVNGLAKTQTTSAVALARFSVAGVLQAYMNGGDISGLVGSSEERTRPLPRVEILEPTPSDIYEDVSNIPIHIRSQWLRWDLEKYAPAYPDEWRDQNNVQFIFKYSEDAGNTWKYLDGTTAKADGAYEASKIYNDTSFVIPGGVAGLEESFTWNTSGFASGTYLLRVEAHRLEPSGSTALTNGYSYHESYFTIRNNE